MSLLLSWSQFRTWRECPKRYRLVYEDREDPPVRESNHFKVPGVVVQEAIEWFYEQQLWRWKKKTEGRLLEKASELFERYVDDHYVNWDHITCPWTRQEAKEKVREMTSNGLKIINRHRLVSKRYWTEMTVAVPFDQLDLPFDPRVLKDDGFKGRIDLLLIEGEGDDERVTLLDGKTTKNPDDVDEDQVLFYALAFLVRYGKMPDRIGYMFYRHGDNPEEDIRWVDSSPSKMKTLKNDIAEAAREIKEETERPATPEPKHCRWCPWEDLCDERQRQKEKNRQKRMSEDDKKRDEILREGEGGEVIGFT